MQINNPAVVAELEALYPVYEPALITIRTIRRIEVVTLGTDHGQITVEFERIRTNASSAPTVGTFQGTLATAF